jgi:hypothetical protein
MTRSIGKHRKRDTLRHAVAITLWSAAVFMAGFLAGCGKAPQARAPLGSVIGSPVPFPTSAAYEPQTGSLIVGSYGDGSLARLPLAPGESRSRAPALPLDGRQNVLRVRVDNTHARLWVLATDAVYVYDTPSSRLLARIPIDEMGQHSSEHCLADMALDAAGNGFVSSALRPEVMRVDARTFETTRRVLQPDADRDKDFGLSALAFADGTLYAASAALGTLWKLDYARGSAQHVEISRPIFGACALHALGSGATNTRSALYVAGGFRAGMMRIDFANGAGPARVSAVNANGGPTVPTDFAIVGHELYIVSSRLIEHPDFASDGMSPSRFSIVRVTAP